MIIDSLDETVLYRLQDFPAYKPKDGKWYDDFSHEKVRRLAYYKAVTEFDKNYMKGYSKGTLKYEKREEGLRSAREQWMEDHRHPHHPRNRGNENMCWITQKRHVMAAIKDFEAFIVYEYKAYIEAGGGWPNYLKQEHADIYNRITGENLWSLISKGPEPRY